MRSHSRLAELHGLATGWALLVALSALASCTQIEVEETKVNVTTPQCANRSGSSGGSSQSTSPMMDTYILQFFELNDPNSTQQSDCDACLSSRTNCHLETAECICKDKIPVAGADLSVLLKGLRVNVPAKYGSLYCLRIEAVERTSELDGNEQCACDSDWQAATAVRLCGASAPYAASSLPVNLEMQCSTARTYSTCLGDPPTN
jgi:hypothetical protein